MFGYILSKKEKGLALITVSLAIAAIVYSFALEPFFQHWQELNKEVSSKTILLKQNYKLLNAYSRLKKEYNRYSRYIELSKPGESINQALGEIEKASQVTSCRIINIKPFPLKGVGSYKEAIFEITAEATVDNFSRFLYELENLKNPLRVKNFTLSPNSYIPGELRGVLRVKKVIFISRAVGSLSE